MKLFEDYKKTLKSTEIDAWLTTRVTRPAAYLFVLVFKKLGFTPNAVTILSLIVGCLSAVFFYHGSFYFEGTTGLEYNLIGVALLYLAIILDCADGQLARLTKQYSLIGRFLDGSGEMVWFLFIYTAIFLRSVRDHSLVFGFLGIPQTDTALTVYSIVIFILIAVSGIFGMGGQLRLADYYTQFHLLLVKGKGGCELETAKLFREKSDSAANPVEKAVWKSFAGYTMLQEKATPQFQRLFRNLRARYGEDTIPAELHDELYKGSKKLVPYVMAVAANLRLITLYVLFSLDLPLLYFVFELVVMGIITGIMRARYERLCSDVADKIEKEV